MDNPRIYRQGKLTFIVMSKRTIVLTDLNQKFFLEPKMHYWRRRLRLINTMIQLGEIQDLNELSEWCGQGIQWTTTDIPVEYYVPEGLPC